VVPTAKASFSSLIPSSSKASMRQLLRFIKI
jgi:hypothetical protein